jgi:predicted PurR-regulated permease PerM
MGAPRFRSATWFNEDARFIRRLLIGIALGTLVYLVWLSSDVLLLCFGAVLVSVLLQGLAGQIGSHLPIARSWSLTLAVILSGAAVALVLALFGTEIAGQLSDVFSILPGAVDAAGERFGVHHASQLLASSVSGPSHASIVSRAAGLGYGVFGVLADIVLVIVAGIYLAADPEVYRRGVVKMVPHEHHEDVAEAMRLTGAALRMWFVGQLVTMALVGSISAATYWLIGLPSPLALGVIAGTTNFIPFAGPILGAIPVLVLASLVDVQTVLWAVVAIFVIQQLEGNVITPQIQKRAVMLPPVVVLFSLTVSTVIFGWAGLILAVPLTVSCSVAVKKLWMRDTLGEFTAIPGDPD